MHGYGFDMGWGGWWMLLFWLGVIALGIWALRWLVVSVRQAEGSSQTATPREIAARRYARGEISRDEYLGLARDLALGESSDDRPYEAKRSEF
jgi:uncharacterized membrane protein